MEVVYFSRNAILGGDLMGDYKAHRITCVDLSTYLGEWTFCAGEAAATTKEK